MKISRIFLLLIFLLPLFFVASEIESPPNGSTIGRENGVLIFTDTTDIVSVPSGAKNVTITIADSAMTGTDTVKAYMRASGVITFNSLIAVHEVSQTTTTTNVTLMVPGAGVTSSYIIPDNVLAQDIYLVRTNTGTDNAYQPKTRWQLTYTY